MLFLCRRPGENREPASVSVQPIVKDQQVFDGFGEGGADRGGGHGGEGEAQWFQLDLVLRPVQSDLITKQRSVRVGRHTVTVFRAYQSINVHWTRLYYTLINHTLYSAIKY